MIKTTCLGCGKEIKDCVCHSPDSWENTAPWDGTVTGDVSSSESDNELIEQLKAIRNRCDAVMWLLENPNAFYVVHTLLEDIYENAQIIVEDFCIEDEEWFYLNGLNFS